MYAIANERHAAIIDVTCPIMSSSGVALGALGSSSSGFIIAELTWPIGHVSGM
jgi:hypothetical protein